MTRSQVAQSKKEIDDLKIKLADYEKMSKFQKAVSSDSTAISGLESKLDQVRPLNQSETVNRIYN